MLQIKMRKYLVILLLLTTGIIYSSEYPGAVFLMIWPGARPTSMAGAFSAIADDATAAYYNSAGLGFLKERHITIMHSPWLPGLYPDMYYEYLGYVQPLRAQGTMAISAIYLTTGKTEVTDGTGLILGDYTTFDLALSGSYGLKLRSDLSVGTSAKLIYSFLVPDWVWRAMPELGIDAGGTGIAWAFDLGVLYRPKSFLSIGAALNNLGPGISYVASTESDPLPRMLRVGICYRPVNSDIIKLNITPEITKVLVGLFKNGATVADEWRDAWKSLGIETTIYNILSLRFGYFEDLTGQRGGILVERNDRTEHIGLGEYLFSSDRGRFANKIGACFGFGVHYRGFQFDVSSDQFIYDFPTQNWKFSLSYRF
ncbi:MAG: PorV/PorQ family protein [candidate division WOR-3 bacterium]